MAKRRKHRRRGTGSVLQVRKLSGLGALGRTNTVMGSLLPVAIGGVVAGGTMIGIRSFMTPDTSTKANVMEYAPWIGFAAGGVAGLALWNMNSQASGLLAIATAGVLTLATVISEAVAKSRMGTAGVGAILMERAGTGAIVPEYSRQGMGDASRGANIRLNGLGKINTGAFGTPGFAVS
jgi:hypothetical protein